jgi:DNA-binding FadR family transcriptional regulator
MKKSHSSDNWAELLRGALAKRGNLPDGEGWRTFDQLVAEQGVTNHALRKAIKALRNDGRLEVFNGAEVVDGTTARRVWYRPLAS